MQYRRLPRPALIGAFFLSILLIGTGLFVFLTSQVTRVSSQKASFDLSKLRLSFEPNVGQTGGSVQYIAHGPGAELFFAPDSVTLAIRTGSSNPDLAGGANPERMSILAAPAPPDVSVTTLRFLNAMPSAVEHGTSAPGKVNYLLGSNSSDWHTDISLYDDITYRSLYPGIDLSYSGENGRLKGTYTVAPAADPAVIAWRYEGAAIRVDVDGNLIVTPDVAQRQANLQILEAAPVAWQEIAGQRVSVDVRYEVHSDGSVGFVVGAFDATRPLVIDPILTYSTYLGGSGTDNGYGLAVDSDHNMYVTGLTSSTDFPLQDPVQPALGGGTDVFISKLNASGTALIYSTYLGGSEIDWVSGIAVDTQGEAAITGRTSSTDFPVMNAIQPSTAGGNEAFVSKLNAQGSGLMFSTYLGGSGNEDANAVAMDYSGDVYVTGSTSSSTDFPIEDAAQPVYGGGPTDAFVTKYSSDGQTYLYSTYLGGDQEFAGDRGFGIAVDSAGNAYVTGDTDSFDFPTVNAFQGTFQGGESDAFVTKINSTGRGFVYSTYLGGSGITGGSGTDSGFAIATDIAGNAYITGNTDSADFPLMNPLQPALRPSYDIFISELNPTGSNLIYSTYLGGNSAGNEAGNAIAVNASGEIAVVGNVDNNEFPVVNPFQATYGGSIDSFVVKLAPSGASADYVSYLGGSGSDYGQGAAIDDGGFVYAAGLTASTDFPLANPYQDHVNTVFDTFISKISDVTGGTPTATLTRTATRTSTPTSTRTSTPTPTPTLAPFCGVLPVPPALTSCQTPPDVYSYSFRFFVEAGCQQPETGSATLRFQVANNPLGPFTLFDEQTRTVTFPAGPATVTFTGTMTETAIPFPYEFYRIDFIAADLVGGATQSTGVSNLCQISTPGPTVSVTTTPIVTATVPPTITPIATDTTSPTTTPSPVVCPQQFTDVDPNSTFYANIQCLACIGIINGYTTGCDTGNPCFRPGNNVTRGQTAKIISNSAGWAEPSGPQQFEDVLPGSTFYDYIWRMADKGYVSGYPCGGPGEPCGPANMPYFRPNSNLTRGQLAKMDSEAAYYIEVPTGQQFEDVLPGSTFYTYTYRLALHNVMSGYPCGGLGEPCGPNNLPYFRPGNSATRGQTTKIVANTFFPDCDFPARDKP
ncbi:MAG TPA: SBBP repeat-containing protein [Chloroflexia bacterium]|nr:SBBP repeat-containing protein [Chloroflexia bacterium]